MYIIYDKKRGDNSILELDISNNQVKEIDNTKDIIQEFINELQNNLENNKWEEKNFINKLGKEFNISQEHLKGLNDKIDDFLQEIYSSVGQVMYIGYDKDTNIFYEAHYNDNNIEKNEMFDEYAKSHGIGTFHISFNNKFPNDNVWYRDADFIETDIKSAIKDYLKDGSDIENITFSILKEKYKDSEYIESLYEKYYN